MTDVSIVIVVSKCVCHLHNKELLYFTLNSVPNLNAIEQSAAELLRFQYLTLWPWTCVACCARLGDIFHQVWPSTSRPLIRAWIIAFLCWYVMSRCDLDLWHVDLESSWYIKRYVISVHEIWTRSRMTAELLIILRIFAHVISRCDLDLDLLTLNFYSTFECHAFKLRTKFERSRTIHGWVTNDLARFRHAILGVGHFYLAVLRGAWTQLHETWQRHRAIIHTEASASHFRYLAAFLTHAAGSSVTPNFSILDPLWKLGDLYINCWSFTYDRTSKIHVSAIHCAAAEHGGLINKKNKESSWVKLEAFPTNVGRPNDSRNQPSTE